MTIYKQPCSPYYYYDSYFEKRRYQASTHLRNKTIADRVECIKKAGLAQSARILPKRQIPLFRDFVSLAWPEHRCGEINSLTYCRSLTKPRGIEERSKLLDRFRRRYRFQFRSAPFVFFAAPGGGDPHVVAQSCRISSEQAVENLPR
jgi:hypothetical protein